MQTLNKDLLDLKVENDFYGLVSKKYLTYYFKNTTSVPTYVLEYLLGMHCNSDEPDKLEEGIEKVKSILQTNYVKRNEIELIKSRIKERGSYVIIDKLEGWLDENRDVYVGQFQNFSLMDFFIPGDYITKYEKLLAGGIWAIAKISYTKGGVRSKLHLMDEEITQPLTKKFFEAMDSPFVIDSIEPIQMPALDFEDIVVQREKYSLDEWMDLMIRSLGYEPESFSLMTKLHFMQRLVPLAVKNYNFVELGPRSTGKSYSYKELSPYSILVSGGYSTAAKLFYNMSKNSIGLIGLWDTVAFDEVAGIQYNDMSVIQIMKDYMTSGSFSRGQDQLTGEASLVFIGNVNESIGQMLKNSHLFSPFPDTFKDDAAFFDRIHSYLPGWEIPKLKPEHFTEHYGFITDYLAEFLKQLRYKQHLDSFHLFFKLNKKVNKRDEIAIFKTLTGMLNILFPNYKETKDDVKLLLEYAIRNRRRVKEQLNIMVGQEFSEVELGYIDLETNQEIIVETNDGIEKTKLSEVTPSVGLVFGVGYNVDKDYLGIYKIENKIVSGDGKFKYEKVYSKQSKEMVNSSFSIFKDYVMHELPYLTFDSKDYLTSISDMQNIGESSSISIAVLVGLASSLLEKVTDQGLVIYGNMNLAGVIEETISLEDVFRSCKHAGANKILIPSNGFAIYEKLSPYYKKNITVYTYDTPKRAIQVALGL